jgi:hypothetical protein
VQKEELSPTFRLAPDDNATHIRALTRYRQTIPRRLHLCHQTTLTRRLGDPAQASASFSREERPSRLLDHCGFERTRRSDAAIAADEWRALAGVERTRAEQARPLGGPGDAVDLDVGEPEGAAGFAFDGATAEQAEPEREVGAGSGVDSLRAPAEELLVDAQAQARLPVWSSRWTTR